jgi:hypothetical protein
VGAGAGLGFSVVGLGWVGALLGGVDSVRVLAGLTGGGEGEGDGGGGGLWSKSRRILMTLVRSSPAMWSARMMSISAVPSPSTARTMATCSSRSRSFPISPGVAALPTPARENFPQTPARFAPRRRGEFFFLFCLFNKYSRNKIWQKFFFEI